MASTLSKAGMTRRLRNGVPMLGAAALLLSACGSATGASGASDETAGLSAELSATPSQTQPAIPAAPATGNPSANAPVQQVLPAVQVREITSGADVDLASLTVASKPTLVWAWAPHCPYCNAEAPKVNDFAENNAAGVTVVGVGTQDSFREAEEFVAKHDLKQPAMVWDESFESWQVMRINSMPTFILLSASGEMLLRVAGKFPEEQIRALI
ncbi:MAG: TlpA family protein disulfide reductase [Actinobacteria bacterium]|nr:TlpA family protein disulfide reductase [Actinomycetota bacterium]